MSLINVREKTIQAKIVYYGTALSGKTTSLKHVHRVIDPDRRIELVSLNTEGDRTFFFDFLPIPLGSVHGYQVRIQAFTVPGQVKYNLTRRYVLRGADAVIFVADSGPQAFEENVRSMQTLVENLAANGLDPERTPLLIQFNKRDVPGAVPVERLREALNRRGVGEFATIATTGEGVFEAFAAMCADVTERLAREYRVGDPAAAREAVERRLIATMISSSAAPPPPPPPPAPVKPAAGDSHGEASSATGTCPSLASVDTGVTGHAVIEVSSASDPDIPDAETLLEHAVQTNIESARLVSELTETRRRLADHVRQLAALHQTGVVISSELDLDRLLDRVLTAALRSVDAEHGSVLLADDRGTLMPRLVHGFMDDPIVASGPPSPEVLDRLLHRRAFLLELDARVGDSRSGSADGVCPMVALVAPIVHQGELLGALSAYVLDRPLDQDLKSRLRFLNAVASQAAAALVNSRLYARVEAFNRDLERRVAERTRELARALEELKALDRLKDDFLASMSHELLTPLQSIGSAAEILAAVAGEDGAQAGRDRAEFSGIVQREAARLGTMLRTVLDFTQIEAGKVEFRRVPVDLREAVLGSYRRLRPDFKAAGARLKVRVEEGIPGACADPDWLGRVLDALLSNAVKFGGAGEVGATIRREGETARVDVRDHGPGVPEALRPAVFERFKQIGDVLTEKPPGLGMGLPMARMLVERMGGRIRVEPAKDVGSVFSFTLPLVPAAAASPAATPV